MAGSDAAKMKSLKNTMNDYIWASPSAPLGTSSVWSVPLIISPSIAAGTWLVGAFAQSTVLFVRQQMTIEFSFEDQDNFIKNLCTIRAEERMALAILNPQGLLTGAVTLAAQSAVKK
jgi:HK97 family phage major capsid protein